MLPCIIELTRYAEEGSITRCARHLTWAAKLLWLTQLCANGANLVGHVELALIECDDPYLLPSVFERIQFLAARALEQIAAEGTKLILRTTTIRGCSPTAAPSGEIMKTT